MKRFLPTLPCLLIGLFCGGPLLLRAEPTGSAFTYQGRLTEGGQPANGHYDLRIGLFPTNANGAATAIVTNLNITVSGGLFTTTLDFGPHLTTGTAFWLEVGTRTNGGGAFTTLTPRQALTPAPYAVHALSAALADGTVTGAKLLDGTVDSADLATSAVTSSKILNGTITTVDLATGSVTTPVLADAAVTAAKIADNAVVTAGVADGAITSAKVKNGSLLGLDLASDTITSVQLDDQIDLGSSIANGTLSVYHTLAGGPGLSLVGAESRISTYGSDGLEQIRLAGATWGELWLNNGTAGNARGVLLTANQSAGGFLALNNSNAIARASLSGANTGGTLTLYQADGGVGVLVDGDSSGSGLIQLRNTNGNTRIALLGQSTTSGNGGELSIHDNSGTETVELLGQANASTGGQLRLWQDDGTLGATLLAEDGNARGGFLGLHNSSGNLSALIDGDDYDDGGSIVLYAADGSISLYLDGDSGGGGNLDIRNTNGLSRVTLDGQSVANGGEISVKDSAGIETVEILGAETITSGGQIKVRAGDGTTTIELDGDVGTGGGGYLRLFKGDGSPGITLQADVNGDGRITTQEIQITGGSDLSEQFDIRSPTGTIAPGMVVCIDPERPGELTVSARAYDRTVAGIVSGAGGVKPGLLMGQRGTEADGKHAVALTGRVYCYVDATQGEIIPGDLLTTSDTPGHAMKAGASDRAQGAVIGKAMTPLKQGRGLVLVLVSLQ